MSEEVEKVDLSELTEEEKQIYLKYGRLPKQNDLIKKRNERLNGVKGKKFDSADWALEKSNETPPAQ